MLPKSIRDKMAEKVKGDYDNNEEEEAPEEGVVEIEVMKLEEPPVDLPSELQSLVDSWDPQTDEGMQYQKDVEDLLAKL